MNNDLLQEQAAISVRSEGKRKDNLVELRFQAIDNDAVLVDKENFRQLQVRIEDAPGEEKQARSLGDLGYVEETFAWLSVSQLRGLGDPDNPSWVTKFDAMIEYARSAGWLNTDGTLVRAHIV